MIKRGCIAALLEAALLLLVFVPFELCVTAPPQLAIETAVINVNAAISAFFSHIETELLSAFAPQMIIGNLAVRDY